MDVIAVRFPLITASGKSTSIACLIMKGVQIPIPIPIAVSITTAKNNFLYAMTYFTIRQRSVRSAYSKVLASGSSSRSRLKVFHPPEWSYQRLDHLPRMRQVPFLLESDGCLGTAHLWQ